MTKEQAQSIRCAQRHGEPVSDEDLREALLTLDPGPRPGGQRRLRKLPAQAQAAADSLLCFNLGRAIGRKA